MSRHRDTDIDPPPRPRYEPDDIPEPDEPTPIDEPPDGPNMPDNPDVKPIGDPPIREPVRSRRDRMKPTVGRRVQKSS
jgi:hypothetical protein